MKYFSHFDQGSELAKYSVVAFSDIYIVFNYIYDVVYQDVILTIFVPRSTDLLSTTSCSLIKGSKSSTMGAQNFLNFEQS